MSAGHIFMTTCQLQTTPSVRLARTRLKYVYGDVGDLTTQSKLGYRISIPCMFKKGGDYPGGHPENTQGYMFQN